MGMSFTTLLCIIAAFLPYTCVANFSAYWNVFLPKSNSTISCVSSLTSILDKYKIQRNTNDSYIGDKVALFYEYFFGRYPYYKKYQLSDPINGGTPQNVSAQDLNRHIEIAIHNITEKLPFGNSSGLGIVDFEEWRPLYDINSMSKEVYKIAAIQITNTTHNGTLNSTMLNQTAEEEYDAAAKQFLLITLQNASEQRPDTLWGMYGFPYCNYNAGTWKNVTENKTIENYRCRSDYLDFNNRMDYIFNASQALFPSIYLNNKSDAGRNFRYVQAIMAETLRIAAKYNNTKPIYVYTKFEYDPVKKLCTFYTKEDLCSTVVLPYRMGASGLIFWSSSNNMTKRCDMVTNFVNTTLGPLVERVIEESKNGTFPRNEYNISSTMWELKNICEPYLDSIANFTDVKCNETLSTVTNTKVAKRAILLQTATSTHDAKAKKAAAVQQS